MTDSALTAMQIDMIDEALKNGYLIQQVKISSQLGGGVVAEHAISGRQMRLDVTNETAAYCKEKMA